MAESDRLRLRDVRAVFRLVSDIHEMGEDPQRWRPRVVVGLRRLLKADIVVSSEVHFRRTDKPGVMRVVDIGWFSDPDGGVSRIHTERDDERPETFWLSGAAEITNASSKNDSTPRDLLVPIKPVEKFHPGRNFILSQYPLPHAAAVDQLGLHRMWGSETFTPAQQKLARLFHVELGRLWRRDVIRRARKPGTDLPPRLAQTLDELLAGSSEKEIATRLGLSPHTIHNYVKALHQRFGVSSRGELLARARKEKSTSPPRLSLDLPRE